MRVHVQHLSYKQRTNGSSVGGISHSGRQTLTSGMWLVWVSLRSRTFFLSCLLQIKQGVADGCLLLIIYHWVTGLLCWWWYNVWHEAEQVGLSGTPGRPLVVTGIRISMWTGRKILSTRFVTLTIMLTHAPVSCPPQYTIPHCWINETSKTIIYKMNHLVAAHCWRRPNLQHRTEISRKRQQTTTERVPNGSNERRGLLVATESETAQYNENKK